MTSWVDWTHSAFAFVRVDELSHRAELHDENGAQWGFYYPAGATGWLPFESSSGGALGRLERTAAGFRYIRPGRNELVFDAVFIPEYRQDATVQYYFLTAENGRDGVQNLGVEYALPVVDGTSCPSLALPGSPVGVPYLNRLLLPGGAFVETEYARHVLDNVPSCHLETLWLRLPGSSSRTKLVQYYYIVEAGPLAGDDVLRLVAAASDYGSEEYSYAAGFSVAKPGGVLAENVFSGELRRVQSQLGHGNAADLSFEMIYYGATPYLHEPDCINQSCNNSKWLMSVTASALQSGGSDLLATSSARSELLSNWGSDGLHRPYVSVRYDECGASQSCSQGAVQVMRAPETGAGGAYARTPGNFGLRDKEGTWNVAVPAVLNTDPAAGEPQPMVVRAQTKLGASNAWATQDTVNATGELIRESYGYRYSSTWHVKQTREDRPSVVEEGLTSSTLHVYDPNGQFELGILEGGFTKSRDSEASEFRWRGTFYRRERVCAPSGTDPHGRVLRVEGPCWFPQPVACSSHAQCQGTAGEVCQEGLCLPTRCAASSAFPVTEFAYYSAGAAPTLVGRLEKVSEYSGGSTCAGQLVTHYQSYSPEGYPLAIEQRLGSSAPGSGVTRHYTYEGGRLTASWSSSVSNALADYHQFTWDNDSLASIIYPTGRVETFCHRNQGIFPSCEGTYSPLIQWHAKSTDADVGSSWSEALLYQYFPEGSLKSMRAVAKERDESGEDVAVVRAIRGQNVDVHGRATFEWSGDYENDAARAMTAVRRFDHNNFVVARSPAASTAPDFCWAAGVPSDACAWMHRDRLGRLLEMRQPTVGPASREEASGTVTCLGYNAVGAVSFAGVASGSGDGCQGDLLRAKAFEWDDFGNLIRSRGAGKYEEGGISDRRRMEYDAQGLLIAEAREGVPQTFQSRTYDLLGRLLTIVENSAAGSQVLVRRSYDLGLVEPGCPESEHTAGHLSMVEDSFGRTWFSYDEAGRLIREYRQRAGTFGACPGDVISNPSTSYVRDANGSVVEVHYPHGRVVTYEYTAKGVGDRVARVLVSRFHEAGALQAVLLDEVRWEPFGALRSYLAHAGNELDSTTVQYVSDGERLDLKLEGSCATAELTDIVDPAIRDQTGRIGALWVSRHPSRDKGVLTPLRQVYRWDGDQISQVSSCLLDGTWSTRQFRYDTVGRLVRSEGVNFPVATAQSSAGSPGEWLSERHFLFAEDGERETSFVDGVPVLHSGEPADLRAGTSDYAATLGVDAGWFRVAQDGQGRAATLDSSGRTVRLSYESGGVPVGAVYRSLEVERDGISGGVFEYFYDWRGQRRLKVLPNSQREELFHFQDGRVLAEQVSGVLWQTDLSVDDWVWLGGRPIAVIRGALTETGGRRSDFYTGGCPSLDGDGFCGAYHVVTDWMGKPVLTMLADQASVVAGYGLYDDFGAVNTALQPRTTTASQWADDWTVQLPAGLPNLSVRVQLEDARLASSGRVSIDGLAVLSGPLSAGMRWSEWSTAAPGSPSEAVTVSVSAGGSSPSLRVVGHKVEFRTFEEDVSTAYFPRLRFPGHRLDEESGWFENWNRIFDPLGGTYLSPEPLLQSPVYVRRMAESGLSVPTYAYALNNPLRYVDPTGLAVGAGFAQCYSECVQQTVFPSPQHAAGLSSAFAASAAAGSEACQTVAGTVAYDLGGPTALETVGSLFRVARGSGAVAAGVAIVAEAACLVQCRIDDSPAYRNLDRSVAEQRDAPWWRFW